MCRVFARARQCKAYPDRLWRNSRRSLHPRFPCVTLRYNTERPETLEVGANILAGTKPEEIVEKTETMLRTAKRWKQPFGDGKAAKRIVKVITEKA